MRQAVQQVNWSKLAAEKQNQIAKLADEIEELKQQLADAQKEILLLKDKLEEAETEIDYLYREQAGASI